MTGMKRKNAIRGGEWHSYNLGNRIINSTTTGLMDGQ